MTKETHKQLVLKHLKTHKTGLTPKIAFEKYGIMRLSGRIYDLRDEGYDIKTDIIAVKDRRGETCHVASYTLES